MGWSALKVWRRLKEDGTAGAQVAREYPSATQQVDVSAELVAAAGADVDYSSNPLRAIVVGDVSVGSAVYVKMLEDAVFFEWNCVQGEYIDGVIVGVGGTVTGTTALKLIGLR
jgi:hypothetical protein